jgi:chemotaxis family two-component system response regulator Rcp1
MKKTVEILLIEDNEGDAFLFKESFKNVKSPHQISVCHDAEEAILYVHRQEKYIEATIPDLIFLDLNLPKRNGLEILKEIKGTSELRHIPVIVFTSSHSDKDIRKSYELYANCYIKKPISIDRFREIAAGIEAFWFNLAELPPA